MTEQERNERIQRSRELLRWSGEYYESDQKLLRKQPPLVKEADGGKVLALPKNFEDLPMEHDFVKIINNRRSNRVFTDGDMDLLTLSFLLWAQQGVKGIRGNNYATLRTVPSAGARHPFECYPLILHVSGLKPGLYHYLALTHELELIKEIDPDDPSFADQVVRSVNGQKWVQKANVIFYYSIIPYRGEWRYAFNAHRVMMIDAGHVTENLYLACSALNLGTCAIAAMDTETASGLFSLDGEEEYIFYCAPVGTVSAENEDAEQAFYAFLKK
ncbi:MAG: SagB/ThcOx family dehydrogenase [Lachnospiraceae bacterium]|nr:SagB/ThcOx family dehydrogenase [Lachnospiraceae bacterium]